MALLRENGVETRTERGDRVFPASDRAWDVAEALVAWARRQGAEIRSRARVDGLDLEDGAFSGLRFTHAGPASGSRPAAPSSPPGGCPTPPPAPPATATGSPRPPATGSTPLRPSLVGIETEPALAAAQGLGLRNVRLTLWIDGKKQASEFGEAEFTAKGLDGPIVLRLSRQIVEALAAGRRTEVALDLKPALDPPMLEARLLREMQARGSCRDLLRSLLPAQLVDVLAGLLGLDPAGPASRLTGPARARLAGLLKELRFQVRGHGGWEDAIVTSGGVAVQDIDPRTLASRKIANLYLRRGGAGPGRQHRRLQPADRLLHRLACRGGRGPGGAGQA